MPRYTSFFSYYGGKSKVAGKYPEPKHDLIVEPFAGAAAYSVRHHEKQVLLADAFEKVQEIWTFLLSEEAEAWIKRIPDEVDKGSRVDDLIPGAPAGLIELMAAQANMGTMGTASCVRAITKFGALHWKRFKDRILYFLPKIKHFEFRKADYRELPDVKATWFVDPPYANVAGRKYAVNEIDYAELADWCLSRKGQLIVCENVGADWLPFKELCPNRGVLGRYQKARAAEAIFHRMSE